MAHERPKQRKGFVLTSVQWDRSGQITRCKYEPVGKAAPPVDHVASTGKPIEVRRSIIAAEQQRLFD